VFSLHPGRGAIAKEFKRKVTSKDLGHANILTNRAGGHAPKTRQCLSQLFQNIVTRFLSQCYTTSAFRWSGKPLARLISYWPFPGADSLLPRNPLFDGAFYAESYKDVTESKHLWAHYLAFGADEGYNPNPYFDTSFYLKSNRDVVASRINPLIHFYQYGAAERRETHPEWAFDPFSLSWHSVRGLTHDSPAASNVDIGDNYGQDQVDPIVAEPAGVLVNGRVVPPAASALAVKLIAFFLPQFYPIKENDEFWGKGFTEWNNVSRAKPLFPGHYQPQLPSELGCYDLRTPEILEQQADLARTYGIYGFCFYYYWFNGRRVLEYPLDQMMQRGKPDFPFCICWANENWTRTWDGAQSEILIEQKYVEDWSFRFIRDVIPVLRDPRYIRVNNAPLLIVYRIDALPDAAGVTRAWRDICASEGIPGLHICAVQSFGIRDPRPYGCDAAIEFPPHTERILIDRKSFPGMRHDFQGYLEDYSSIARNQLGLPWPDYPWYRGVMPAFDNTPRRGARAHIYINSDPSQYEFWLSEAIRQTLGRRKIQEPIAFLNAWNEWGEGAYLEPDQKYGRQRLLATNRALVKAGDAIY